MTAFAANECVGVIVPMHNAQDTIAETLDSICRQSHRALDIVVVDDGSVDRSNQIVTEMARGDPRIRLVHQANAGVAAARNRGACETGADILAFVDADDIWAPEKIAAQIEALKQCPGPALVYCWFAQIDACSRAYPVYVNRLIEGEVLAEICRNNFVGNGSSLLVPRDIFERVGGFDPSLHANRAQGCEDLLFCASAARLYPFKVVPRYLLGYRITHRNMSSDTARMLRSFDLVAARIKTEVPQYAALWTEHRRSFLLWLARRAVMAGRVAEGAALANQAAANSKGTRWEVVRDLGTTWLKSRLLPPWAKDVAVRARLSPQRLNYQELAW
ncbi:MAG TPA: glycosyltransferase family A protein [Novosphingobium sp.]|nr:glycosyltransferase family A protein [Novosphingobium sp.]